MTQNLQIKLLFAPGYRRNISLQRIRDHQCLGRAFRRLAAVEKKPDVVLCSLPTLELSCNAVDYGKRARVPVVLDIRDMWPDVFLRHVPRYGTAVAKLALTPMFKMARSACAEAFAICAHAPGFVEWGLRYAEREQTDLDRDFPFGYVARKPTVKEMEAATAFWRSRGIGHESGAKTICFFGTVGHQFDFETVIRAARRLRGDGTLKIVICGVGDRLEFYRRAAADCDNVFFPGWVNAPEIHALMAISKIALAPYVNTPDFEVSVPNKIIEYLSGGLPVVTSLQRGAVPELLSKNGCGLSYDATPDGLVDCLGMLFQSTPRLESMSQRAIRLFRERFTAEKVYSEMAAHLRKVSLAYHTNKPN